MSINVRITVAIGILLYYCVIITLIKMRQMSIRHSLLWMFFGVIFIILDAFPAIASKAASFMGIQVAYNALILIFIAIMFVILIMLSGVISRQSERIRELVQYTALIEKRIRMLEGKDE